MSRAFVVQLNAECEPEITLAGRVEHVRSGEWARFQSWDELRSFMIRILRNECDGQDAPRLH